MRPFCTLSRYYFKIKYVLLATFYGSYHHLWYSCGNYFASDKESNSLFTIIYAIIPMQFVAKIAYLCDKHDRHHRNTQIGKSNRDPENDVGKTDNFSIFAVGKMDEL